MGSRRLFSAMVLYPAKVLVTVMLLTQSQVAPESRDIPLSLLTRPRFPT